MACLGFEPTATWWEAQKIPRSYGKLIWLNDKLVLNLIKTFRS